MDGIITDKAVAEEVIYLLRQLNSVISFASSRGMEIRLEALYMQSDDGTGIFPQIAIKFAKRL